MKSIVLIIPYFGRLPDFFPVWKQSALCNNTVDFLFFTDIKELKDEGNIRTIHLTFDDFRQKLAAKFDFPISLRVPYKLCDYKPAYGYALTEYIDGYDFWGHCDIDLVFGDIRHFITDEILDGHRKILEHGHFTLYHNDPETNEVFMHCPGYKDYDYRKVFTSNESMYFDECLGTQLIFRKEEIPTYCNLDIFFQINTGHKNFRYKYKNQNDVIFRHHDGKLFSLRQSDGDTVREEIMYAHFLKREIDTSGYCGQSSFYIIPNRVVVCDSEPGPGWFSPRGDGVYMLRQKYMHVKSYIRRFRSGEYSSSSQYRNLRKELRDDMRQAKKLVRAYREKE